MDRIACTTRHQRTGGRLLASVAVLALLSVGGCREEPLDEAAPPAGDGPESRQTVPERVDAEYPVVRLETNVGAISIRLNAVQAPLTVRNFLNYVDGGFYSNTLIHYVADGKMILGGGYGVDGAPKPTSGSIRNEAHNGLQNRRGTIAMARDIGVGIDSATSQFFINLADAPTFDYRGDTSEEYGYCVFGDVVEGLELADRIARSPTIDRGGDLAEVPDPPVIVTAVKVVR